MTIGEKIAAVVGGHKDHTTASAADGSRYPTASSQAQQSTYTTSSNSSAGALEQAGAGEYRASNANYTGGGPHLAGAGAGHQVSGVDMVCVPGNVAAPVPVGEKKFIVTEDHAVAKQRVERWTEHQPVEREYVTKVEETGHVQAGATYAEGAAGAERVVNEHTCYPTNTTTVTGVAGDTANIDSNRATAGSAAVGTNRVV